MKTRLVTILDTWTKTYCLINQFEEIDNEICKEIGIPTNYKIINIFRGTYVSTIAGYDFHPNHHFENRIITDTDRGTSEAIRDIIHQTKDIRYLPEIIDVEKTRLASIRLESSSFNIQPFLEIINDYDDGNNNLRKVLIGNKEFNKIKIIDINTHEEVYYEAAFRTLEEVVPKYLWIPLEELKQNEFADNIPELKNIKEELSNPIVEKLTSKLPLFNDFVKLDNPYAVILPKKNNI